MKLHYCFTLKHVDKEKTSFVNLHFKASKWQILKLFHALGFLLPTSNITSLQLSLIDSKGQPLPIAHTDGSKFLSNLHEILQNLGG